MGIQKHDSVIADSLIWWRIFLLFYYYYFFLIDIFLETNWDVIMTFVHRTFRVLCGMKRRWIGNLRNTWQEPSITWRICVSLMLATFAWEPSLWVWIVLLVPHYWGVGKPRVLVFGAQQLLILQNVQFNKNFFSSILRIISNWSMKYSQFDDVILKEETEQQIVCIRSCCFN